MLDNMMMEKPIDVICLVPSAIKHGDVNKVARLDLTHILHRLLRRLNIKCLIKVSFVANTLQRLVAFRIISVCKIRPSNYEALEGYQSVDILKFIDGDVVHW